jgi:hypothetical protein
MHATGARSALIVTAKGNMAHSGATHWVVAHLCDTDDCNGKLLRFRISLTGQNVDK